jgi:hypothetical protein
MSERTRTLAWIWLGLAVVWLVLGGWMGRSWQVGSDSPLSIVALGVWIVLLVAFWAVPLTVGCVALLRGQEYGWWVLMVVASLACLPFGLGTLQSLVFLLDGYVLRSLPAPAMLAFSILTIRWLRRDPPGKWA